MWLRFIRINIACYCSKERASTFKKQIQGGFQAYYKNASTFFGSILLIIYLDSFKIILIIIFFYLLTTAVV